MSGWEVESDGETGWFLHWRGESRLICPHHWHENFAIDAALEYMDRKREGRIPRDCSGDGHLMAICAKSARRQR